MKGNIRHPQIGSLFEVIRTVWFKLTYMLLAKVYPVLALYSNKMFNVMNTELNKTYYKFQSSNNYKSSLKLNDQIIDIIKIAWFELIRTTCSWYVCLRPNAFSTLQRKKWKVKSIFATKPRRHRNDPNSPTRTNTRLPTDFGKIFNSKQRNVNSHSNHPIINANRLIIEIIRNIQRASWTAGCQTIHSSEQWIATK